MPMSSGHTRGKNTTSFSDLFRIFKSKKNNNNGFGPKFGIEAENVGERPAPKFGKEADNSLVKFHGLSNFSAGLANDMFGCAVTDSKPGS